MRTLSQRDFALLAAPNGAATHLRVKVQDTDGTWHNMSALAGTDWVRSVAFDDTLDQPVAQATVAFVRGSGRHSLARDDTASLFNNLTGSYAPLVAEGRPFTVEVATTAVGRAPVDAAVTLLDAQPAVTLPATQALSAVRVVDTNFAVNAPVPSFTGGAVPPFMAGTVRVSIVNPAGDGSFSWQKTSGSAAGSTGQAMFADGEEVANELVDDDAGAGVGVAVAWSEGESYAAGDTWEFDITLSPAQTVTSSQPTLSVPDAALLAFSGPVLVEVVQGSPGYTFRYTLGGAAPRTVAMQRGTPVPLLLADDSPSGLTLTWPNVTTHYAGARWTWRAVQSDWREAFRGRFDSVEVGDNTVTAVGRDLGGVLMSQMIEVERSYGSEAGVPVQTVMQGILDDNGFSHVGLYTPVNPDWVLGPYAQKREPVLAALRALAHQLGWEVRYRWQSSVNDWRLTFYEPERAKTAVDWQLGPGTYRTVGPFRSGLEDVRNVVEVVYSDKNDLDASGTPKRKTAKKEDLVSILKYGRNWMQLVEASSSNIDTPEEADRLALAGLTDLSTPATTAEVESDVVLWHLETGDLVRLLPNDVHHTTTYELAVYAVAHDFRDDGTCRTRVQLRGKPCASVYDWMKRDARPMVAPSSPFTGPSAPSSLKPSPVVNGFSLTFSPPTTGPKPAAYALYVGSAPGFPLDASTFKAKSSSTRFELTDLPPGTTRYARVVPLDARENAGPPSAEVPVTTRYVEPRLLQPRITFSALPMNPDFEAANDPATPPDGWETYGTATWGSDLTLDTSVVRSGTNALKVINGILQSALFAVVGGDEYLMEAYHYGGGFGPPADVYVFGLRWFSDATTSIGVTETTGASFSAAWSRDRLRATAPAGSKYCRAYVGKYFSTGTPLYVDSVRVEKFLSQEDWRPLGMATGWSEFAPGVAPVAYYRDAMSVNRLRGRAKPPVSSPLGVVANLLNEYRPSSLVTRLVAASNGWARVTVATNGDVSVEATENASPAWIALDGVEWRSAT